MPPKECPTSTYGPGMGPGVERRMQVVHHVGEDLRPGPRITEAIAGSVEGADARFLRDHGLGFVPDHRPAE